MKKFKELYGKLPQEVKIFLEYILPAAILTALIDYLGGIDLENTTVMAVINIALIFLRQLKPRYDRLKK